MGCNNSHLRPFFRRCRRRRSGKKDEASVTPKGGGDMVMIDHGNHYDSGNVGNQDIFQGLQFLGSSVIRNPANKQLDASSNDSPFCVPLLAQSEASSSQLDFFRMLDEKIEEGPDYDPDPDEARIEYEIHRKHNLEVWRKGIQSFSSNRRQSEPKFTRCHWDEDGD